jgi:3',5'-cyclic AMP phosphodiesterase CpdA
MLRLAHISDLHKVKITWNPWRLFSKRFFGNLNYLLHRKKVLVKEPLEALIPFLSRLSIDQILLGGDFTTTALTEEFEEAKEWVNRLPFSWIAIPGNHDCYTRRSYKTKRFYYYFGQKTLATPSLEKHGVQAHALNDLYWLVCLDTAKATSLSSSRGLFSKEHEAALVSLLKTLPKEAFILVLNHYPFFANDVKKRTLERGAALEEILRGDPRIKAYLQGHSHRHTIADLQVSGLPLILDSGSAADGRRGTWNLLTFEKEGVQIDVCRWNGHAWGFERTEKIVWKRGI